MKFYVSFFKLRGSVLIALSCLLLSACLPDSASVRPSGDATRQAQRDAEAGRYKNAAQKFERLASNATGSQRDAYLLDASRAWFNHGESIRGLTSLKKVRGELPQNDAIVGMLLATDDLVNNNPKAGLAQLDTIKRLIRNTQLPAYLELRARALGMSGDAVGLIRTFSERETWLSNAADIKQNRRLIWHSLRELGRKGHKLEAPQFADRNVAGWLELARLYRDYGRNPAGLAQKMGVWNQTYARHAATSVSQELSADLTPASGDYPVTVALLLPVTGRLSGPGTAIRDGFISAYMNDADNEKRPLIKVYDTGSQAATDAYRRAMQEGAQFVVGPLSKSSVSDIVEDKAVQTTTLALNYLNDTQQAPVNFFQFSLAPEHESAAIAQKALSEGKNRAIALIPETDLGNRLLQSFSNSFESGGGVLLDVQAYNPNEKDFAAPITNLLNLNSSKARHREVSSIVGTSLEFEPRRRQDAQFVFLVAGAEQGRLLRPQLNYHYANDLPVLSTAAIFEDKPGLNRKDLEGVVFADTPWIISDADDIELRRRALSDAWPQRAKRHGRLFAMGMDAYDLIPQLYGQPQPLAEGMPGMTGLLSLGFGNRINRALEIATIKSGRAVPLLIIPEVEFSEDDEDLAGGSL